MYRAVVTEPRMKRKTITFMSFSLGKSERGGHFTTGTDSALLTVHFTGIRECTLPTVVGRLQCLHFAGNISSQQCLPPSKGKKQSGQPTRLIENPLYGPGPCANVSKMSQTAAHDICVQQQHILAQANGSSGSGGDLRASRGYLREGGSS